MKLEVEVRQKVAVTHLIAKMDVRYWEDANVNGQEEDNDAPKMPLIEGSTWSLKIELETGKIEGWPAGVTASTHYKVCDAGVYTVLDATGKEIATIDGYVPDMMAPSGEGYGDYVIMDIGADGVIANWRADLSCFSDGAA